MPETWTISAGGRVYGPYSAEQMQTFHAEGRLAAHSLVARAGQSVFRPAGEDPELAFVLPQMPSASPSAGPQSAARPAEPHRFGREPGAAPAEPTRFVIVSDMKSGSIAALEEEIFSLGPAYRFMPQAWILSSVASLNTIRHSLVEKLGKLDTLFLVDCAHDRAAWFNFGPEAETRMRRLWSRVSEDMRQAG